MRSAINAAPSQRRPRLIFLSLLTLLASWLVLPPAALAHAVLQASMPASNATIDAAKLSGNVPIVLTFNSRIDAAHSSLSLMKPDGRPMPLTVATKAAPNVLSSKAVGIQPGRYSLRWQVVAGDGHISRGSLSFNVR